ncbi:Gfo/Idh/MocA family oxidoreductase [Paenibacillus albiflavus]|uniref:Gfo/Idh/MocA family oxidoreductase n=1 Tax=Paenibacillus albiflavus TaxID=2545760 RepID=A0A4R4EE69_9BACL|nr:Gfo/Idh/MocA family oxidoreductase [Paenibacillus albiflavus]TCZ77513.1 Gfo/Idh/MocA family oxidoreductase [Paenibacillus albiflavus]
MINVGVVGAGYWGKNLVKTFYEMGCLAAVVEIDPELANKVKSQFPEIPVYPDYDQLLESTISAVVIATPAHTHAALAEKALLAGKDVFVEKPITLSVNEAERLHEIAETNNRILMVGHMLVYQPAIRFVKEFIDSGRIGTLYSLHQTRLKLGKVRTIENVLWSLGVHDIAVCLYLINRGNPNVAINGHKVLQRSIDDDIYLHLQFDNIHAHLHTSWLWPKQERRLVLIGSEGSLVYDELDQTVTFHRNYIDANLKEVMQGSELIFRGEAEPLKLECHHFITCIQERKRPLTDGAQGIAVIQIIEQAINLLNKGDWNE